MTGPVERWGRRLLALSPLMIGLPVLVSIVGNVVDLASLHHPFTTDVSGTSNDALSIFRGGPLFQDPDVGYTPQAYPPLLPLLSAGLDELHLWSGWPNIVVVAATLGLAGLAAHLAYRPASRAPLDRLAAAGGAVGFGLLVWWLVSFLPFNFLYSPRADQLLWALALPGLALLPAVASGSRPALVGSVLLLTGAAWSKQTAVMPWLVALLVLGLAAYAGRARWRDWLGFAGGLAALNLLLFAALQVGTHGWGGRFILDLPSRHPRVVGMRQAVPEELRGAGTGLILAAVLALAVGVAAWRSASGEGGRAVWRWPEDRRVQIGCVIGLFVVLDFLPAAYFRGPLGAEHNAYIGVAWGAGMVAAVAFGLALQRRGTAVVAGLAVVALFVVSETGSWRRSLADHKIYVSEKSKDIIAMEEPAGLRDYARSRSVYHPLFTDLNEAPRGWLYPTHQNIEGLLAAGYQPGYVVDALLNRRFDVVFAFDDGRSHEDLAATGTFEDDYLWKLDEVIRAKYRPMAAPPPALTGALQVTAVLYTYMSPGVFERRPGPDPAPWMRHCFGPFHVAGMEWNIRHGGGFWCRPGGRGSVLRLVRTKELFSELRASDAPDVTDRSLTVAMPGRRGGFTLAAGAGSERWELSGNARPRGEVELSLTVAARRAATVTVRPGKDGAGPVRLRFVRAEAGLGAGRDAVTVALPHGSKGSLSLFASFDSGATYDLAGLDQPSRAATAAATSSAKRTTESPLRSRG